MAELPRADEHGEDCTMGGASEKANENPASYLTGRMGIAHCHDCWKYTDDLTERNQLVHEATMLMINATVTLEQTDAFKAADAYLAKRFSAATGPSVSESRWKL
jgi:hypothetical protein